MGFPLLVRCHLYIELGPWTHMGHRANIIIKDIIHNFASFSKNKCVFCWWDRVIKSIDTINPYILIHNKYKYWWNAEMTLYWQYLTPPFLWWYCAGHQAVSLVWWVVIYGATSWQGSHKLVFMHNPQVSVVGSTCWIQGLENDIII